ncbi:hypothetical protein SKAU_G00252890 [Synaphobranchus kaupii]|uniref:Uncharacterized protein n=1 Tax=Synaphobranchus kaupii TaxID=118154 RepID=A0A9Q1F374_SYNKA|nr:hypothetical protein SKAU_G00252890 [Synaphobranchus kaupii]
MEINEIEIITSILCFGEGRTRSRTGWHREEAAVKTQGRRERKQLSPGRAHQNIGTAECATTVASKSRAFTAIRLLPPGFSCRMPIKINRAKMAPLQHYQNPEHLATLDCAAHLLGNGAAAGRVRSPRVHQPQRSQIHAGRRSDGPNLQMRFGLPNGKE